jgi:hypothetical protein
VEKLEKMVHCKLRAKFVHNMSQLRLRHDVGKCPEGLFPKQNVIAYTLIKR